MKSQVKFLRHLTPGGNADLYVGQCVDNGTKVVVKSLARIPPSPTLGKHLHGRYLS